jgi:hypothetical protein
MEMNKSGRIKGELLRQEAEAILVAKTGAKGSEGEEGIAGCEVGGDLRSGREDCSSPPVRSGQMKTKQSWKS